MAPPTRARFPAVRRALVALALCVAAATAVAGCGGGSDDRLSKDEYMQEFADIGADLESSFDQLINADVDENDFDQVADLADTLGDNLEELANRVDALSPPEEIEEAHDKLVAGLEEFAAWAHELADTVRTAPASELVDVLEQYGLSAGFDPAKVPGADKIQEAVEEYRAAGYELGESTSTETETGATGEGDPEAGKVVFRDIADCGLCHTLADAGSTGVIGPDLDAAAPSYSLVLDRVTNGRGVMPSFGSRLSQQQIQDVAAYVSSVAGG